MQIIISMTIRLLIPCFSVLQLIILNEVEDLYSVYFSCQIQLNYFTRTQKNTLWDPETEIKSF